MAAVKDEECKLKKDKHNFLLEVQKLRVASELPGSRIQMEHASNEITQLRSTLEQERRNYMHQFRQMEQRVVDANSGSKSLETKMKILYSELSSRLDDKEGVDQLFNEVMNSEEQA